MRFVGAAPGVATGGGQAGEEVGAGKAGVGIRGRSGLDGRGDAVEASVGIVGVLHGIVQAEREAGVAAEGVGGAGDDIGGTCLQIDDRLGGKREGEGVVGVVMRRQKCLRHLLPPQAVVGTMDWILHRDCYLLFSGLTLTSADFPTVFFQTVHSNSSTDSSEPLPNRLKIPSNSMGYGSTVPPVPFLWDASEFY